MDREVKRQESEADFNDEKRVSLTLGVAVSQERKGSTNEKKTLKSLLFFEYETTGHQTVSSLLKHFTLFLSRFLLPNQYSYNEYHI